MHNSITAALLLIFIIISACSKLKKTYNKSSGNAKTKSHFSVEEVFKFSANHYRKLIDSSRDTLKIPYSGNAVGTWEHVPTDDWMSAFLVEYFGTFMSITGSFTGCKQQNIGLPRSKKNNL